MKKYLKVLIAVLIIILLIGIINILKKDEITMDEVLEIINPSITSNMSLKIISNGIDENLSEEYYLNDKLAYENFYINDEKIQEFTFDFETKKQVNIFHYSKEIFLYEIKDQNLNIISNRLNHYKDWISKSLENSYKYYGNENINNNKIIKFSVDFDENFFFNVETPTRLYFYIDIENKSIQKVEHYNIVNNKEELVSTETFIYSYDTVTDENILKFDINNYPDYVIKYGEN